MTQKASVIVIREADNVGTAARDISRGERLHILAGAKQCELVAREDIRFLHKIALRDIACGERVYKYGAVIGESIADIAAGEHVHIHNLRSLWGRTSD